MASYDKSDTVRLEVATPRDATKLLKFISAYYRFDRIPLDRKALALALSLLLENQALGRAFFIRTRGRVVGYMILTFGFDLEFGGRQATVTDFYINSGHRRKGVGRRL